MDQLLARNAGLEELLEEHVALANELKMVGSRASEHFLKHPGLARQLIELLTREAHTEEHRHRRAYLCY